METNFRRSMMWCEGGVRLGRVLLVLLCLGVVGWIALSLIPTPSSHGSFEPVKVSTKGVEGSEYSVVLDEQLVFRAADGEEWIAPKGTYTDGASIPQLALSLTGGPFDEQYREAAVVHDAYCQKINAERCPEQYQSRTWQEVHDMFYEACLANGTPPTLAKMMWAAVYLGGPRWDDTTSASQDERAEALEYGMAGCMEWIEKSDADFGDLKAEVKERERIQLELYRNEKEISDAFEAGRLEDARRLLDQQQEALDKEAVGRPDDLMIRAFRGHTRKNRALLFHQKNQPVRAAAELSKAENDFMTIVEKRAMDAKALGGLGALSELELKRGKLDQAERLNKEVLKLSPESRAALERKREIDKGKR